MNKVGKVGLIIAMIFVLAGCQTNKKEETKKAEPKVTQTKKKTKETSTTSEKQPAASTPVMQEEPAANPAADNNQGNAANQAGQTANNTSQANTQQQAADLSQTEQPNEIATPGVYSREECIHIARMTISMSGADETQFAEDQLYNYYDQCAQLGADYSYLLGLVAQDTGADKQALIEQYHLAHNLNPDGTDRE